MATILLISPYWKEPHRWMVSTVKLAELWQRRGHRVIVACMGGHDGKISHVAVEKVSDTLEIHRVQDLFLKDPWNYGIAFGFSGYAAKLARERRPDLIVINKLLFWTSLAGIGLRLRGHRVLQLTDALVGMTWWPRTFVPRVCAAIYAWTLGWLELLLAERVVFFHPQPEALLRRLGIARKTTVIPTGIDPQPYGPPRRDPSAVTVTYVGRLESIKGVDDFLAAVAPLVDQYPQLRVQVVGWFEQGHRLVAQYSNRVTFTGLREDIPALLAGSDVFVLPSHSEGLSNALMEAMASGCTCVASDVGGNRFLLQNGVSGFLYPAGDIEALRAHLRRLIEDPAKREALGAAARKRIETTFSWEVIGKEYDALFASFSSRR